MTLQEAMRMLLEPGSKRIRHNSWDAGSFIWTSTARGLLFDEKGNTQYTIPYIATGWEVWTEPKPPLLIFIGKTYRLRNGQVARIAGFNLAVPSSSPLFWVGWVGHQSEWTTIQSWRDDGRRYTVDDRDSPYDILEEIVGRS